MIKVVHIISGDLWAGAEVLLYNLLKYQRVFADLSLSAVLLNDGQLAHKLRALQIPVCVMDERRYGFSQLVHNISAHLGISIPHVIHSHRYKENILAFLTTSFGRKARLVATQHGMPELFAHEATLKHRLLTRGNFFLLKHAFDRVIAVSEDIKNSFVSRFRIQSGRVTIIRNGIEIPEVVSTRDRGEDFVIGSAGRLFAVKDYPLFVEAAKLIAETQSNVRFRLAGDGPEMEALRLLIARCGLSSKFELLGQIGDMAAFFRSLDLYVSTSIHEGIPLSVLEAMSYGLPVVAPRVGGLGEIIEDSRQGFLVEQRNPENFAQTCLRIIRNEALHHALSAAAKDRVARFFSAAQMAKSYYRLYHELARGGGA